MAETGIPEIDVEYLRQLTDAAIAAAEDRGYQRGLAERNAELATAKARIVALGVEGDEMDQKHLDELRERDERVRSLEALLVEARLYIGVLRLIGRIKDTLAASAPVGEQEKTSEVAATTANDATVPSPVRSRNFALSPPAEAPQESGVPSGIPTCDDCGEEFDPMFGVCRNVLHKQRTPGTFRGEYERMARDAWREWYQDGADTHSSARKRNRS